MNLDKETIKKNKRIECFYSNLTDWAMELRSSA